MCNLKRKNSKRDLFSLACSFYKDLIMTYQNREIIKNWITQKGQHQKNPAVRYDGKTLFYHEEPIAIIEHNCIIAHDELKDSTIYDLIIEYQGKNFILYSDKLDVNLDHVRKHLRDRLLYYVKHKELLIKEETRAIYKAHYEDFKLFLKQVYHARIQTELKDIYNRLNTSEFLKEIKRDISYHNGRYK